MRLLFSGLITLPLISSLLLIAWFEKSCTIQMIISEKIMYSITPLRLFEFGVMFQFLMMVICSYGIVAHPAQPVLSFGTSIWITILSVFMSISAVAAVKNFPRLLESTKSFDQNLVEQAKLYELVDYLQTTHKCCGLTNYNDYKTSDISDFLKVESKMETFADVPMSCCAKEVKGCNLNVFSGVSDLVNRDFGCYDVILASVSRCNSNLMSWTIIFLFAQAIYINILTWAHLRRQQNLSFWMFGRIRRRPAFGPSPIIEEQMPLDILPDNDIDSTLIVSAGAVGDWRDSKGAHQD